VDRPVLTARLRQLELVDVVLTRTAGQLRPHSLTGRKRFPSYTNPSHPEIRDLIYEMFPLLVRLRRLVWIQCNHPDVFNELERFAEPSMLRELHLAICLRHNHPKVATNPLQLKKRIMVSFLCFCISLVPRPPVV
jgi:hypothetical protein